MKTKLEQKILIGVFLTCIFSFGILTLLNLSQKTLVLENRVAAEFPDIMKSPGEFPLALQSFINDRLAFRQDLTKIRSFLKLSLFGVSPVPSVITGLNKWLFYSDYLELQNQTISAEDVNDWRHCIRSRRIKVESHGAKYLFVIVPDKSIVYKEHLPKWLQRDTHLLRSDLISNMIAQKDPADVLYLRDVLEKNKSIGNLFQKFDTHWNLLGAFIGTREAISCLRKKTTQLTDLKFEDFSLTWSKNESQIADLCKIIGTDNLLKEPLPLMLPKDKSYTIEDFEASENRKTIFHFKSRNNDSGLRVLVIGDSFARAMLPFLSTKCSEVFFSYDRELLEQNLEKLHPDIVIDETLAVSLSRIPPAAWTCLNESERGKTLLQLSQPISASKFSKLAGCTINPQNGKIEVDTNDPQLILPPIRTDSTKAKVLVLDMESPAIDDIEVFYQTAYNANFERRHSARKKGRKGHNILFLELPPQACGQLRFDPGTVSGTYKINLLEVYEIK